jgi:hypothetical protein
MELDAIEIGFTHGDDDLVKGSVYEDAVALDIARQMRRDSANLLYRDAAGAWSKNKTDSAGPVIRGVLGIGKAGVPTDFDPHMYM